MEVRWVLYIYIYMCKGMDIIWGLRGCSVLWIVRDFSPLEKRGKNLVDSGGQKNLVESGVGSVLLLFM